MLTREEALLKIYNRHGDNAIYVTTTGYISRAMYNLFSNNKNIFYMQGSMGMSPAIALGMAKISKLPIVSINGDGAFLMHLGLTHTVHEEALENLYVYVLDNGCHESVGGQKCSPLQEKYIGTTKIYKISCDGKTPRVKKGFKQNAKEISNLLKINRKV
tara:strand:+ start:302 stop:778 length:477 start_codon:yes stop_codon:yes gene_type:complete